MAIRFREGRKSPWQVYWNNPFTGKRESANFVTEREAQKHDSLVKHRLKFDRESFLPDEMEDERDITLEHAYILYLKEKQFEKRNLACQLYSMRPILKEYGQRPLKDFDKGVCLEILEKLQAPGIKGSTVCREFGILRALLKWSVEKGMSEPILFPRMPKADNDKFIPPTPQELEAMLAVAPEHIQRVIIIGTQCGARVGQCELLQLTWEEVDFERRVLKIQSSRKNRKARWRDVPLKKSLLPILRAWKDKDALEGMGNIVHFQGKPVNCIKRAWKTMLEKARIKRRIRPYDLRHAFATELIANGADIGTVAKLMGHCSPSMILTHYQYVMDRQKREAIESLPELAYVPKYMCPKEKGLHGLTQPLEISGGEEGT